MDTNQLVVYGKFGVGTIFEVEKVSVNGTEKRMYHIQTKDMKVKVYEDNPSLRKLSNKEDIDRVDHILSSNFSLNQKKYKNWTQKSRYYTLAINSGDIIEIAKIKKELDEKELLNFSEKEYLRICTEFIEAEKAFFKNNN